MASRKEILTHCPCYPLTPLPKKTLSNLEEDRSQQHASHPKNKCAHPTRTSTLSVICSRVPSCRLSSGPTRPSGYRDRDKESTQPVDASEDGVLSQVTPIGLCFSSFPSLQTLGVSQRVPSEEALQRSTRPGLLGREDRQVDARPNYPTRRIRPGPTKIHLEICIQEVQQKSGGSRRIGELNLPREI